MSRKDRKIKNFLLMPFVQLRLGLLVIGMMSLLLTVVFFFVYLFFSEFINLLANLPEVPTMLVQKAQDDLGRVFKLLFVLGIMVFTATLILIIVETHKIVGAAYAINKFVKENLQNKKYDQKLTLRKGDHFQDLAESINELAEKLKNSESTNSKDT